jgi:rSAM/selenodomain-associated transferase 2
MLSIIIPTLNAASSLTATLTACKPIEATIIVSDGGSSDRTSNIAQSMGATVVHSEPGRGTQLKTGAAHAMGEAHAMGAARITCEWLLFLHADSIPTRGWEAHVEAFMNNPENLGRAAVFHLKLDDTSTQARRIEWWVAQRTRLLGLPYGDQGLLISREHYDRLGGYSAIPLMEDVDIIRRIGRRNLYCLPSHITTSAARYQKDGYWKRPLRNLSLLTLYFLGFPPRTLARLYS